MPALERQKELKDGFGYTDSLDYMRPCIKKQVTKVTRMWEKDGHTPQALWERRCNSLIKQLSATCKALPGFHAQHQNEKAKQTSQTFWSNLDQSTGEPGASHAESG